MARNALRPLFSLQHFTFASPISFCTRGIVAKASKQLGQGPIAALHDDVTTRFHQAAQGSPPNLSTGQLIQLLFEVGAADVKTQDVGTVVNKLMEHGYYRMTHPQKPDSYGPIDPPTVGLLETKRWASMLFLDRLKKQEQGDMDAKAVSVSKVLRQGRGRGGPALDKAATCGAVWCQCPPGSAGTKDCALRAKTWETTPSTRS